MRPQRFILDVEGESVPLALAFAEPSTFTVQAAGKVTFEESHALLGELYRHPRLCCGAQIYVDGREVKSAPNTAELRALALNLKPLLDRGLGPIVIVTSSAFVYGVARMFSVFAEAIGATVYAARSEEDAQEWLAAHPARVA